MIIGCDTSYYYSLLKWTWFERDLQFTHILQLHLICNDGLLRPKLYWLVLFLSWTWVPGLSFKMCFFPYNGFEYDSMTHAIEIHTKTILLERPGNYLISLKVACTQWTVRIFICTWTLQSLMKDIMASPQDNHWSYQTKKSDCFFMNQSLSISPVRIARKCCKQLTLSNFK